MTTMPMEPIKLGTFCLLKDGMPEKDFESNSDSTPYSWQELLFIFKENAPSKYSYFEGKNYVGHWPGGRSYIDPRFMKKISQTRKDRCLRIHQRTRHVQYEKIKGNRILGLGKGLSIITTDTVIEVEPIRHDTGRIEYLLATTKSDDGIYYTYRLLPGLSYQPWWQELRDADLFSEERIAFRPGDTT